MENKEYCKKHYYENKEQRLGYQSQYRKDHKEAVNAANRRSYARRKLRLAGERIDHPVSTLFAD